MAIIYYKKIKSGEITIDDVPERVWIQCYWYDYLRTYEQGINDAWMEFLDGGQKLIRDGTMNILKKSMILRSISEHLAQFRTSTSVVTILPSGVVSQTNNGNFFNLSLKSL